MNNSVPSCAGWTEPRAILLRDQPGADTGCWAALEAEGQAWGQAAGRPRNWVRWEIGAPNLCHHPVASHSFSVSETLS